MGIGKLYLKALNLTNVTLNDFVFKCTFRVSPKDFSRERKMGFRETILFMLNMAKRSMQLELNSFFENIIKKDSPISKQGYSEARQKINPEVFIELNKNINELIYNDTDKAYRTWKGFRLCAIDGSILELPDTKELRESFGTAKGNGCEVARARTCCLYDIENRIILKSMIGKYDSAERKMAMELLNQSSSEKKEKELILMDRGYPSAEIIAFMLDRRYDFVMRAQRNFSNAVVNANEEDQIITVVHNQKEYQVRLLRFILDSGEEEILLSSLMDKDLGVATFKELYFKRWGIETKYGELKNKLQIENFSGTTTIVILQDFFATIYLSNMINWQDSTMMNALARKMRQPN